jgi:hypothetical protein
VHDEEKNGLCPPVVFSGDVADLAPGLALSRAFDPSSRRAQATFLITGTGSG